MVLVEKDLTFPADLILLDSELNDGICFIETGSLDGEKTLKQRDKDTPLRNSMKIKFFFEYKESYILGIRFEDG